MQSWKDLGLGSILVRMGLVMGVIVALALLTIVGSSIFNELTTGKAQAINVGGSLRMLTYRAASQALDRQDPGRVERVRQTVSEFELRLRSDALLATPSGANPKINADHEAIAARWNDAIRPLLVEAAGSDETPVDFLPTINQFVGRIDAFVLLIENETEQRVRQQRVLQASALVVIIVMVLVAMIMMQLSVVQPLTDLLRCATAIRAGDFSVRTTVEDQNELGQLGKAFNIMVEDLSRMYAGLEAQVEAKTRELAQTNRSLDLLYRTSRALSVGELTPQTLIAVLRDIEQVFGVQAGAICVTEPGLDRAFTLAANLPGKDTMPVLCERTRCRECIDRKLGACDEAAAGDDNARIVSIPLGDGEREYGLMPLAVAPGQCLADWQMQLLTEVGRHIGGALATVRRNDELRRLALLEERSAIARELHDSLAQSLSYLKIQVTRLETLLARQAPAEQTAQVLGELRDGLGSAYRQLRELLATFRLRVEGGSVFGVLDETIKAFEARTGIPVAFSNRAPGLELGANQAIHLLQVVREALSNVERHAEAHHVWIDLGLSDERQVHVRVDDDGRGLPEGPTPSDHFGLIIIEDRAKSLNGRATIARRPEGGTRVEVEFTAAPRYVSAAGDASQPTLIFTS